MTDLAIAIIIGFFGSSVVTASIIGAVRLHQARRRPKQNILEALEKTFSFHLDLNSDPTRSTASGDLDGHRITVTFVAWQPPSGAARTVMQEEAAKAEKRSLLPYQNTWSAELSPPAFSPQANSKIFLHIRLDSGGRLARALHITRQLRDLPVKPEGDFRVIAEIQDLLALNRSVTFEEAMIADLKRLDGDSYNYSIHENVIDIFLPETATTPDSLVRMVAAAARVAAGLREMARRHDLYLHVLCQKLERSRDASEIEACLRELPTQRFDRAFILPSLRQLLDFPDFNVSFLAAGELELDLYQFITGRMGTWDEKDRAKALHALCEYHVPGGTDYLIDYFNKTHSVRIKKAVIDACFEFPGPGGDEVFLSGLRDPSPEVRAAAVEVLAIRGGLDALPLLLEIGRDEAAAPALRRQAQSAAGAITRRLGLTSEGQLSLADGAPGEGGLSLEEEDHPE